VSKLGLEVDGLVEVGLEEDGLEVDGLEEDGLEVSGALGELGASVDVSFFLGLATVSVGWDVGLWAKTIRAAIPASTNTNMAAIRILKAFIGYFPKEGHSLPHLPYMINPLMDAGVAAGALFPEIDLELFLGAAKLPFAVLVANGSREIEPEVGRTQEYVAE
jgi:hypothetical protein